MFNFRIVPSVLFASVLVSSVGLNANAQKAPSITDKGSILGFDYQIWNKPGYPDDPEYTWRSLSTDFWENHGSLFTRYNGHYKTKYLPENPVILKYSNPTGFRGLYSYKGESGKITADVSMDVLFTERSGTGILKGYIGKNKNIVIGGYNFGHIKFSSHSPGGSHNYLASSYYSLSNDKNPDSGSDRDWFNIAYSKDESATTPPSYIAGGLTLRAFSDSTFYTVDDSSLNGVFVAALDGESTNDTPELVEPVTNIEPSVTDFWENHGSLFAGSFDTTKYLPENPVILKYSNPTGFRGLYSYKGESGKITADVSMDVLFTERSGTGILKGYIGKNKNIVIGGYNFGHIKFANRGSEFYSSRKLISNWDYSLSNDKDPRIGGSSQLTIAYSKDESATTPPSYIAGSLALKEFSDSTLYRVNDSSLDGVFVAKASDGGITNNTPEPVTLTEEDKEFSGANGWRDIDYTAQEIRELGIPDELLDKDDTKIGLERTTDGGLSRENHVSLIRHANPTFQLWGVEEGRRGFPHHHQPKKAEGCRHGQICTEEKASIIYSAQFKNHFDKLEELSEDDKKIWQKEVTTAIGKGFLQWIHHLDYNPGHLDVSLDDKREYNYNTKNHEGGGLFSNIFNFISRQVSGQAGTAAGEVSDAFGLISGIVESSKTLSKLAIGSTVVWNPALAAASLAVTEGAEKLLEKATTEERTLFSTKWLDSLYDKYEQGQKEDARQELITEATRTGGDEFGFIYPYATSFPNTPLYHPNNIGSVMNKKSDSETSYNFGVIRQDVERIPNGNYNNSYAKKFDIHKTWQRRFWFNNTFTARYGAWLTHEFKIEGVNGESSFKETDMISARPYFQANDHLDDKIPTVSATYSGEDNFLGVDMSAHFLGAVLEADAQVIYNYSPDSPLGSSATVTIDNFRVFTGETITGIPSIPTIDLISEKKRTLPLVGGKTNEEIFAESWRSRNGSISYTLSCGDGSCNSPDNKTAELTFYGGERYAGGTISDRENEYVGGFITERE